MTDPVVGDQKTQLFVGTLRTMINAIFGSSGTKVEHYFSTQVLIDLLVNICWMFPIFVLPNKVSLVILCLMLVFLATSIFLIFTDDDSTKIRAKSIRKILGRSILLKLFKRFFSSRFDPVQEEEKEKSSDTNDEEDL